MRTRSSYSGVSAAAALLVLTSGSAWAVNNANQLCSASANPCIINSSVEIDANATLDFGARTLRLQNGGQLDFGSGAATVLCGNFEVTAWGNGPRLKVKGTVSGQGTKGGYARIVARGRCTGNTAVACMSDAECAAASLGTCNPATGNITLDDDVRGDANPAGSVKFVAYGSFQSTAVINVNNGGLNLDEADGGEVDIKTQVGAVTIGERIDLNGGSNAQGGSLFIDSGGNVTINEHVDATGGDRGGGTIEIRAAGNLVVNKDLNARSDVGQGLGGNIHLGAKGNITVAGTSSTSQTLLNVMGHAQGDYAGNAGSIEIDSGGAANIGPYAVLQAQATAADGEGGEIEVSACDLRLNNNATVDATGTAGGAIELVGVNVLIVSASAAVHANGDDDEDGTVVLITKRGTCSNSSNTCLQNSDCTVGCSTGQCSVTYSTSGVTTQFDPPATRSDLEEQPDCSP